MISSLQKHAHIPQYAKISAWLTVCAILFISISVIPACSPDKPKFNRQSNQQTSKNSKEQAEKLEEYEQLHPESETFDILGR
ncbi:hypothetical protein [Poriferisphaera corsica]|nr:hypothetical protein [Poriferisphaera corsica]